MMPAIDSVCGVLLAGGQSRRMGGGDKCLRPLGDRPILGHVVERAQPQVASLVLNANGDPARFDGFGLPVASDVVGDVDGGFAGPLAGVLTGLAWAKRHAPASRWVASFACDAPFLPRDLVARLLAAVERDGAELACATSDDRDHPVFGLWPVALEDDLRRAMSEEGVRKVDIWTGRFRLARVEWPVEPYDPFFNTNRPDDLAAAEQLLTVNAGEGLAAPEPA